MLRGGEYYSYRGPMNVGGEVDDGYFATPPGTAAIGHCNAAWGNNTGWLHEGAVDPNVFSFTQGGLSGHFFGSGGSDEKDRFVTSGRKR